MKQKSQLQTETGFFVLKRGANSVMRTSIIKNFFKVHDFSFFTDEKSDIKQIDSSGEKTGQMLLIAI